MSKHIERYPVFATRGTYTAMAVKLEAARRSYKILKSKADGITVRFRAVSRNVVHYKDQIHAVMKEAYLTFAETKFVMGNFNTSVMESISLAKANQKVDASTEHVVGVFLTYLNVVEDGPDNYTLIGLGTGYAMMMKLKACFKRAIKLLVKVTSLEAAFLKFDRSLIDTNRRLNACGHVVIPRLEFTLCWINSELNEMEREEFFRMKKIKAKKAREAEAKEKAERDAKKELLGGGEGGQFPPSPCQSVVDHGDIMKEKPFSAAYKEEFDPSLICPGRGVCPGEKGRPPAASVTFKEEFDPSLICPGRAVCPGEKGRPPAASVTFREEFDPSLICPGRNVCPGEKGRPPAAFKEEFDPNLICPGRAVCPGEKGRLPAAFKEEFDPSLICPGRAVCAGEKGRAPAAFKEELDPSLICPGRNVCPGEKGRHVEDLASTSQEQSDPGYYAFIPECCKMKYPPAIPDCCIPDKKVTSLNVVLEIPTDPSTVALSIGTQVHGHTVVVQTSAPPIASTSQPCAPTKAILSLQPYVPPSEGKPFLQGMKCRQRSEGLREMEESAVPKPGVSEASQAFRCTPGGPRPPGGCVGQHRAKRCDICCRFCPKCSNHDPRLHNCSHGKDEHNK